jgi:serine/threonine protein kinase
MHLKGSDAMFRSPSGFALGHYALEEPLGAGGMGVVFSARDTRTEQRVALKVLNPGRLDLRARARARETAKTLIGVAHPNIVRIYDFGTHGDLDYVVMEHVGGKSLATMMAEGRMPQGQVVRLGAQLARGLAAAHDAGVIHRDIKPGNVRVTTDWTLKIMDFGVSAFRWQARKPGAPSPSELLPALAGSVLYMAPERLLGFPADQRSDIFSAGAVLYEMAFGYPLVSGMDPVQTIHAILTARRTALPAGSAAVAPELAEVIQRALHREPARRFPRAADMAAALESIPPAPSPSQSAD